MRNEITINQRIFSYDIIRITAMLCVIMIHISAHYVTTYTTDMESINLSNFTVGNFFDSLSRIAVPMFVMLSGSLILNENKNYTIQKMIQKSARVGVILYSWSLFYAIFLVIGRLVLDKSTSITEFISQFINGEYHLWYLFMAIGLYLITPVLKKIVKKENIKIVKYFIVLSIFFQFFTPILDLLLNHYIGNYIEKYNLAQKYFHKFYIFTGYTTYYVLGWFITNEPLSKKQSNLLYALGILGFIITFLGVQYFTPKISMAYEVFYSNLSINILLYSVAAFHFLYSHINKASMKLKNHIKTISDLSFGVYLIHVFFLISISKIFSLLNITIINATMDITIRFVMTSVLSILSIYILKCIPMLRKLVEL